MGTNGVLTTLVSFYALTTGAYPYAGLVQGSHGNLYGTTGFGTNGNGSVFRVSTNGVLTNLVSFGGTDGKEPLTGLVEGSDGNFYGTTSRGGASDNGTVFRVSTNGALTSLVSFAPTIAANPEAGLVQGRDGSFYGTTGAGGAHGKGTVFRMDTNGALTTLVSFAGTNGQSPSAGLLEGRDRNFYGTTAGGGANTNGTVFRMGTNGLLTTLFSFAGTNGSRPTSDLVQGSDGYFYGTTYNGGPNDYGTGFKMDTNGVLTTLAYFVGTNGIYPNSPLAQGSDGYFYGTTWGGGANDHGTLFRMDPNGGLTTLFSFGLTNGADPVGLLQASDGYFYGTTSAGGEGGGGVVFRFKLDPAILAAPASQSAGVGSSVTFSVSVQGTMPFSYQWLFNGQPLAGQTNATLTLNNVSANQAGAYSVIVSNSAGTVTSASANLVVTTLTSATESIRDTFGPGDQFLPTSAMDVTWEANRKQLIAMPFVVSTNADYALASVSLAMAREFGTNLVITVVEDSLRSPTGPVVETLAVGPTNMPVSPSNPKVVQFASSHYPTLSAGQMYWIVLQPQIQNFTNADDDASYDWFISPLDVEPSTNLVAGTFSYDAEATNLPPWSVYNGHLTAFRVSGVRLPLLTIHPAAEGVQITWPSETNAQYQVEWSTSLSTDSWNSLGAGVMGTGQTNSVFDPTTNAPHKFYRVRQKIE